MTRSRPISAGAVLSIATPSLRVAVWLLLALSFPVSTLADTKRIVVIKADGLAFDVVDRLVHKQDPYTGKSVLPWIDHVFYKNGTRLSEFHSRGLSVSVPSWAMLDTGQQSLIKGNVEFDRWTLEPYDYLNTFMFLMKNSTGHPTGTTASTVMDEFGVPVVSDAFAPSERYVSVQVTARELKSISAVKVLKGFVSLQNPKEWFDEWAIGLEGMGVLFDVFERDFIAQLKNPRIRYLDFLAPFFDHISHSSRESEAQQQAIRDIDDVIKNVWTTIQDGPQSDETVLVLISDHGMNSDEAIYSQGFNLIDFFSGAAGGGHHILTNRPPRADFSFKALSPTTPLIVTSSPSSYYLQGKASDYPTLAIDADGNERASIYLRQSDLNVLHILLLQLQRKDLPRELRSAALQSFFEIVERHRTMWSMELSELDEELSAIRRSTPATRQSQADGLRYQEYLRTLHNLLTLIPGKFDPGRYKIEQLIPKRALGHSNSVYDLQNYVIGVGDEGLVLRPNGSLDMERSFSRVNYFSLLQDIQVRNNVQPAVSTRPVNFIAMRIDPRDLTGELLNLVGQARTGLWLYQETENQAVILGRVRPDGQFESRYVPVRGLIQDESGQVHCTVREWSKDLPLNIWEDLALPVGERAVWLDAWHTDSEWFQAYHAGKYTNAVVNLQELFRLEFESARATTSDAKMIARFRERKRKLSVADFVVFSNDHWNFNFRGFNPGGNHGGFFRASTHSTLMFWGGNETGVPRGLLIEQPYDSLSVAPTLLRLSGKTEQARALRGPDIHELFPED